MEIELWHGLLETTLEADDREGEEDEKECGKVTKPFGSCSRKAPRTTFCCVLGQECSNPWHPFDFGRSHQVWRVSAVLHCCTATGVQGPGCSNRHVGYFLAKQTLVELIWIDYKSRFIQPRKDVLVPKVKAL